MSLSTPSIGGVAAGATFICIIAFCGTAFKYRMWPFNLIFAGGSKHSHAVGHREHRVAPETPIVISDGEALEAAKMYEKHDVQTDNNGDQVVDTKEHLHAHHHEREHKHDNHKHEHHEHKHHKRDHKHHEAEKS
jgi:hypothetical protein